MAGIFHVGEGDTVNAARKVEFDAMIDPADTRKRLVAGLSAGAGTGRSSGRRYVDVW